MEWHYLLCLVKKISMRAVNFVKSAQVGREIMGFAQFAMLYIFTFFNSTIITKHYSY
jgi:phage terminase large subunit GpA-like protein